MGRGTITQEIKEKADALLGIKNMSQEELRLMPYVQFVMMNGQRIDPNKINATERKVLAEWRAKGWIEGGASGMTITKTFWDAINEIMWLAYVSPAEG